MKFSFYFINNYAKLYFHTGLCVTEYELKITILTRALGIKYS